MRAGQRWCRLVTWPRKAGVKWPTGRSQWGPGAGPTWLARDRRIREGAKANSERTNGGQRLEQERTAEDRLQSHAQMRGRRGLKVLAKMTRKGTLATERATEPYNTGSRKCLYPHIWHRPSQIHFGRICSRGPSSCEIRAHHSCIRAYSYQQFFFLSGVS